MATCQWFQTMVINENRASSPVCLSSWCVWHFLDCQWFKWLGICLRRPYQEILVFFYQFMIIKPVEHVMLSCCFVCMLRKEHFYPLTLEPRGVLSLSVSICLSVQPYELAYPCNVPRNIFKIFETPLKYYLSIKIWPILSLLYLQVWRQSTLVQIMSWHSGGKPLPEPIMTHFTDVFIPYQFTAPFGQCHCCWCPSALCRQVISSFSLALTCRWIFQEEYFNCIISVLRSDRKCKLQIFSQKNSTQQGPMVYCLHYRPPIWLR